MFLAKDLHLWFDQPKIVNMNRSYLISLTTHMSLDILEIFPSVLSYKIFASPI